MQWVVGLPLRGCPSATTASGVGGVDNQHAGPYPELLMTHSYTENDDVQPPYAKSAMSVSASRHISHAHEDS